MKHALNITREENFPEWYQEVVAKADLAENSNTRGAMVIKPYGYAIWENIKNALDKKIKEHGVQNACFPALIPVELMERVVWGMLPKGRLGRQIYKKLFVYADENHKQTAQNPTPLTFKSLGGK